MRTSGGTYAAKVKTQWLVKPGQCLVCGGRGGYPSSHPEKTILCTRCGGTGRDPQRGSDWYMDIVLPLQIKGLA